MNQLFDGFGEGLATGQVNWVKDEVRLILLDLTKYKFNSTDQFLSSVAKEARVATSGPLQGKSVAGFVCDADDLIMERVTGPRCAAAVLVQLGSFDRTSRLLLWLDEAEWLPYLPNGGNLQVTWFNGPDKLFRF